MTESDNSKRFHILIVEDDRPLAGGLCRALQNDRTTTISCHTLREAEALLAGGYRQDKARVEVSGDSGAAGTGGGNGTDGTNGGKGADTRTDFSLVVLDVNLPDGNGFDFLREIKKIYDISVIMLTANDMETDIVAGLEMGSDDYITKPFSLAVLRARVETQLRRVAQSRPASGGAAGGAVTGAAGDMTASGGINGSMVLGNAAADSAAMSAEEGWTTDGAYRFHFARMLFFHGEEQVELSKTEQRLLRMLVENKRATLTREQLLDYTWSVDAAFVDENTLSVAVKRLRDKLGAQERIKTVYGIGYRWE